MRFLNVLLCVPFVCAPLSRCLRSCTLVQAPADNDAGWGETPVLHILRGVNGIEADSSWDSKRQWKPGKTYQRTTLFVPFLRETTQITKYFPIVIYEKLPGVNRWVEPENVL